MLMACARATGNGLNSNKLFLKNRLCYVDNSGKRQLYGFVCESYILMITEYTLDLQCLV